MKINKPNFWNTKYSFLSILLSPLTLLVILFIFLKRTFTKSMRFNIPIICVGNIYIGGTGKTPTSINIAKELTVLGKKPVILRKFYKEHKDEHDLIKQNFNHLILSKNRVEGVIKAQKLNYDTIVLDDGFQDFKIEKDLNILCFNQNQLIGNGFIFPSGPLRENLNSLKNAEIILINGEKNIEFEKKILNINKNLKIFYSSYKPVNIDQFKNKKLLSFAGIGNPNNFFELLLKNNLIVKKKLIYPDHYNFSKKEISNIVEEAKINNYQIITTEKDYLRIKDFKYDEIKYLKVSLDIKDKKKLLEVILKLYDQKN
jgi:tetraacyldisaccharide 4'-kinase